MEFLNELSHRNISLYLFGWACLTGVLFCSIMWWQSDTQVLGISAWVKPLKFFLSSWILVWTMAWFVGYLDQKAVVQGYTWVVIVVLAFELVYITWQAGKGELSHFNVSSAFHGMMFSLMGLAISIMTLFTAYIGYLFFTGTFPDLPAPYLWGIRFGLVLFVIFAFEGGLMGAQLSHTVGAPDGGKGLRLLNWSVTHGDLRIAHFVGMHALQVLPLAGYFLLSSWRGVIVLAVVYFIIALGILAQALMGIPLIRQ